MESKRLKKDEIERRKNHAKILFTRDGITTQAELSEKVGISERTVRKWIAEEGWQKLQRNFLLTREEQMANMLDELVELNASIKKKPEGSRYADSKEADARSKLTKSIKEMETKAATHEIVHACIALLNFIRNVDLSKAQELSKYVDAFIKSKMR